MVDTKNNDLKFSSIYLFWIGFGTLTNESHNPRKDVFELGGFITKSKTWGA